jgi:hypothetical protein
MIETMKNLTTRPEAYHHNCFGYCTQCHTNHSLGLGNARNKALQLFRELETNKTIARSQHQLHEPLLSTDQLFSEARGKMFGVLECATQDNLIKWLYSFSGQYNGLWLADGWVPPLFDVDSFRCINDPAERQIKEISREFDQAPIMSPYRRNLHKKRKKLSQKLMQEIHALYKLHNFRNEKISFTELLGNTAGKPTGLGDCCAPKLLNYAALSGLAPISLAEFYFGRNNRSQSRNHGQFYPACSEKCQPLIGFLLCGAEKRT